MPRFKRAPLDTPMLLSDVVAKTLVGRVAARRVISRALWQEVAGIGFARRTYPDKLVRGTLHVMVHSSSWAHELSLHETHILERLRAYDIEVHKLKFHVTKVEPFQYAGLNAPTQQEENEAAQSVQISEEQQRALEPISNVQLRTVLENTVRASLRYQAKRSLSSRVAHENRAIPAVPNNLPPPLQLEPVDIVKSTSKLR